MIPPKDLFGLSEGVLNGSVTDLQQLCDRIADCSKSELCIIEPAFYIHLNPDRIPVKSTPAVTTDIELARWSLVGIAASLGRIDVRLERSRLLVTWNWTQHATTPALRRPIAELWMLAIETKDEDVLNLQVSLHGFGCVTSLRFVTASLIVDCTGNESFVTTLLEATGGVGHFTSAALKYVKTIPSVVDLKYLEVTSEGVRMELVQAVSMFSCSVEFILGMSMDSAAIREGFLARHSIRHIFSTLRILQPHIHDVGGTEKAFALSFRYLFFLLERADVPVLVFHEALRGHALEIAVHMVPFVPVEMEANLHNTSTALFKILFHYLVHDKILTYTYKHVDAWSNTFGPIARQHKKILEDWSALEQTIRSYASLRSNLKEKTIMQALSNEKGCVLVVALRETSSSGNARDVKLYGTAQSDASVIPGIVTIGSSSPHYVKRSLRLLAALEDRQMSYQGDDDIPKLVAAAQQQYPTDNERLVVELCVDQLDVSVRPLRHYLFLFKGLSESDVVKSLSSWKLKEPRSRRAFLCSVIAINDQYHSQQILFSPRTALNMEMKLGRRCY
ncbi:uncharacterized protein EDB93DRAFT_1103660 [Suillus bovinus]|uniref:uncharacterized protein n=1 Tax=Suillus bovinus TaxID=48563 RepID=UPI001B8771A5|nr:uncharacterized protein EDB93DRAFT_1103660 [Suillus bovinus]KAG2149097.1 hypothetical protein EDB93DRAFT_1103660 [Suillus bovinus]